MTQAATLSETDLIGVVHRLRQSTDAALTQALTQAALDLTPRQRQVLASIRDETKRLGRAPCQRELEAASFVDRSTLSDVVRRMIKAGLVARRRTRNDARAYAVAVTPKGQDALKQSDRIARAAERDMLAAGSEVRGMIDRLAAMRV